MAPKRQSRRHQLGIQHSSVGESAASRWKRLAPDWYNAGRDDAPTESAPAVPAPSQRGSRKILKPSAADNTITRYDEPFVRHARRGPTADAVASLEAKGVTALVADLIQDRYSLAATLSNASLLKTWRLFHHEAFGHECPEVPVLPITVRKLVIIGAMFKIGGYRSYSNYVTIIRSQHLEAGFLWCQLLLHTSGWVTRSVLRGIGPERQSCSFAVPRLLALPRDHEPLVPLGPYNPVHLTILATLFLMREVEATTARVSAWTFHMDTLELKWHLPASKSDHLALGVHRTLPCFCDLDSLPCAFHIALDHLQWLQASQFSSDGSSPLFPTSAGTFATKHAVVNTFEKIGTACGQPLLSDHGLRLFGVTPHASLGPSTTQRPDWR